MPRNSGRVSNPRRIDVVPEASRITAALTRHAHRIPDLESVVLFGSSVDGTFDKRSDIDLLLLFDVHENPERSHLALVIKVLGDVRKEAGVNREVTPVLASMHRNELDRDFLANVRRGGIVVWARPDRYLPPAKDPSRQTLIRWETGGLTPAQRARIHRLLFGASGSKRVGDKSYTWSVPGLISKAKRYGPGTLLVATEDAPRIVDALKACGVRPETQRFLIP